jgi:FixJ family two-component response regulator
LLPDRSAPCARLSFPSSAVVQYLRGGMTDVDPLNLVVVDDDADVRTALRRLLRSMGHDVQVFASAEEYEDCPAAADCLIVDLRLPGLNGFELRDRLRLRGSAIPIVFITGDGGPSSGDTMAHAGTPSLAKPFNDSDLLAAITRAVSTSPVVT